MRNAGRTVIPEFRESHLSVIARSFMLLGVVLLVTSCARPRPAQHPSEVAEIPGSAFTIMISSFPEERIFLAGAYYRFESHPKNSKNWVSAMEFRHDDPVPIPRQNVTFLTSRSAFVFMGWKYAVTTDGGAHWKVWDAEKDLPGWECCNYGLINRVELTQDGHGKMSLSPIQDRKGEVPELVTSDFGGHWASPQ